MKSLGKYWKVLIALLLVLIAVWIYMNKYQTEKAAYEAESKQLQSIIDVLEDQIAENLQFKDVQDQLEDSKAQLEDSRVELYQHFPKELKEEDQIMYGLYLEKVFGTEIKLWEVMQGNNHIDNKLSSMGVLPKQQWSIGSNQHYYDVSGNKLGPIPGVEQYMGTNFHFGSAQVLAPLMDPEGANLMGLILVVNYKTTYEGFKDMINYLAQDDFVTSIYEATVSYNAKKDLAEGTLYLILYTVDSAREYEAPDIKQFETGKDNIYK
ncbi:MAG: hypothetical protein IJN67_02570 [Oscillospiraceae bacterium]|nr:hypothetical protein [Oscillospiraceae bacterium]